MLIIVTDNYAHFAVVKINKIIIMGKGAGGAQLFLLFFVMPP